MRFLVVLVLLTSCVEGKDGETPVVSGAIQKLIPMTVNRQIDILFVIDNSPAMVEHQARLQTNLRNFISVLKTVNGGLPDVHIGVITTNVGGEGCTSSDDGRLRTTTGMTGPYLVDFVGDAGTRLRNYDGDLSDTFARLADVGTSGCAKTKPLSAARRAVENDVNRGFFRAHAYLALFFITANDAPETDVESYESFFKGLFADSSKVIVNGVLGVTDPTANLPRFLARFPNRSSQVAITSDDWTPAFQNVGGLLKTSLGSPCIEGPLLDIDPVTPGAQFECSVWYEFPIGGEVVPACDSTVFGSCWKIVEDRQYCPFDQSSLFKIESPRFDMPSDTMLHIECLSR